MDEPVKSPWIDRSVQIFGKYRVAQINEANGLAYAISDIYNAALNGTSLDSVLPSPWQSTPEKTALARQMHEDAARKQFDAFFGQKQQSALVRAIRFGRKIKDKLRFN